MVAVDRHPVHVLWLTSGLGCDGDSVAMTAARNPSFEDLIRGCYPGAPAVIMYNPLLAYETGDEFMRAWFDAAVGRLDPFILVLEGSVPNEDISGEGYWATMGVDPATGDPISTCTWIDRLAPRAASVLALGTCATFGGIPAMRNNPTGAMGLRDYLGWSWRSRLDVPIVNLPGCPAQPDNITETLLHLSLHAAGAAPVIDVDEHGRPRWLFARTVQQGCGRAGFAEHGVFAQTPADHRGCLVKLGCKGPGGEVQRSAPGVGGRRRRLPERRRHLQRMHDAGLSRQVHAVHGRESARSSVLERGAAHVRARSSPPPQARDAAALRPRAGLARAGQGADQRLRAALVRI